MLFWDNPLRVTQNGRAAVRCRPQPDDVRRMRHWPVVDVVGLMLKGNVNGHELSNSVGRRFRNQRAIQAVESGGWLHAQLHCVLSLAVFLASGTRLAKNLS